MQPQGPEDEAKGVEMEADFEGALHDVPEDPDANDAESEEGDDERLQQVLFNAHSADHTLIHRRMLSERLVGKSRQ